MSAEALELLHPQVRELVEQRGWKLTPVQDAATADLVDGKDRILVAPTGSGKTEAAVLPIASRALKEDWNSLSILYITCLLYTSPSPRDLSTSRMPSSA